MSDRTQIRIAVVGMGYVGLPLALAFAREFPGTVGFDLNADKIRLIEHGEDPTDEGLALDLQHTGLKVSADKSVLSGANFFVVAVPTPVDQNHNPDLAALRGACQSIGSQLKGGETVVFESTVYPGLTEDLCGPWLEKASGLKSGKNFKLGYSPERINPGDKQHQLASIVKVVSGQDHATLELIAGIYGKIVKVGVHRAPSIKVAEAAKVIENTQRDLNIALMNELAIIFDKMNISTKEVLDAASTKWNFLKFSPGLVGGHCIGVDPYYLTAKAEQLGYHPQVILAGRRINDSMGKFIAQKLVKLMVNAGIQPKGARVGVLGITFKENVTDIRNSRVPDIILELSEFGVQVLVHDPLVKSEHAWHEYGLQLSAISEFKDLDGVVFAVPHRELLKIGGNGISKFLKKKAVVVDVKAVLQRSELGQDIMYWSL